MAYSGYLIKVGNYVFPLHYIAYESYKPNIKGQDLDSYRDANGKLHRNALNNAIMKVEFETLEGLKDTEVESIMNGVRSNYVNAVEKSALVTAYIPEYNTYKTQLCYVPDIEFTIKKIENNKTVVYKPFRFAAIGYGD